MSSFGFASGDRDLFLMVLTVFTIFLVGFSAYLYLEVNKLKKAGKILFAGKGGRDLEDVILGQIEKNKELEQAVISLKDMDQRIINALSYAVQKVGVVRFNPFGEVGGNQSFAVAFLDNYNTGVIMLSLYSRDGVRIYAKPIKSGKSEYQLSKEEEQALQIAMEK